MKQPSLQDRLHGALLGVFAGTVEFTGRCVRDLDPVLRWPRDRVPGDGYVVSNLVAATWRLTNPPGCESQELDPQPGWGPALPGDRNHPGCENRVLAAINLGGDTDTTGAIVEHCLDQWSSHGPG